MLCHMILGQSIRNILNFECSDRTDSNTELIQVLLRSHEISCVRVRTVVNYSFEFAPIHNLCPTSVFFWNLICKPMVLCDGFLHH